MSRQTLYDVVIIALAALAVMFALGFIESAVAGELVVYTALEDDEVSIYKKDFEAKHPDITVRIVRDSTGIITAKLLAEKDNPQADVIWGVALTSLAIMDQKGMLKEYNPAGIERIKPGFKDEKNKVAHWVGIKAWMTGIVGNTIELKKKGLPLPDSYEALADPKYKGMIVMPNPASSGTGYLTISAIFQLMGEDKGWAYLDRLHANIAAYTHSGSKPAKLAGTGEYPIGVSFAYRGFKQKAKGEPVDVAFPKEGCGWDLEANALVRKPRTNPNAKVFLDWAISDDAMKMYSQVYPILAIKMDVDVPEGYPSDPEKLLIKNDFDWAAENRERILAEWSKRYDGKSEKE
ncbi:MAG: putative 2-aminoethylphosphonate ABC transporter substrate-binding protein [Deltaproteobacteria bacterium]|nr:putative 2-aminoethylphosphonate ABC transporter substrate-binding protein [Deltaproteobacteria bacterium]MCB9489196.1 putative 2-aminoethylphosphonate ABC transporter substrate-binding protein [Deltaproteobacteria bacterium]